MSNPRFANARCLLIDGYNLLHAVEKGFINSLETQRESLLTKLHDYQVQKKMEITIVFDGSGAASGFPKRDKFGEMSVVFTDAEVTADEWISEACERVPGSYIVVSSDREVIREAERFGCVSISSQEFLKKLTSISMVIENPYLEDKGEPDDESSLYPRVTTKKKGVAKRLPKRERRKHHQLKNL
ncbi:MAG: uncharacterized protein JWQ35_458 [Bacteriovoracaceae bacterium]|nr:uncharacterized protein [Bacteriovoracaceae bacterium]